MVKKWKKFPGKEALKFLTADGRSSASLWCQVPLRQWRNRMPLPSQSVWPRPITWKLAMLLPLTCPSAEANCTSWPLWKTCQATHSSAIWMCIFPSETANRTTGRIGATSFSCGPIPRPAGTRWLKMPSPSSKR